MADLFTAYDFLLSPGVNRLIQLGVKSTKSITIYKRLKKLLWIKINAWFTWHERKKNLFWKKKNFHAVFLRYLFVGICLPQCSFVFFWACFLTIFWKGTSHFLVTQCSILDIARVLNPPQYAPTWIAYTNNLQVPGER